jgi:hypothetical protein
MINPITLKTSQMIKDLLEELEKLYDADCLYLNGPIEPNLINFARETIDLTRKEDKRHTKLCVILTTNGGDAITVERLVNIFRYNYSEVDFIIPDHAYSAGTILCMSGDNIHMDYNSVLGPIDPQVQNKEGRFVPALGYLGKIEDLLVKAQAGTISEAEFLILKDFDLAEISLYEQARDLTEDLLVKWLVQFKFKNWGTHSSNGMGVSEDEKRERAKEIAKALSDYSRWKSHGRPLSIEVLSELKLQIEDFGQSPDKQNLILECHNMCEDFMRLQQIDAIIFTRRTL